MFTTFLLLLGVARATDGLSPSQRIEVSLGPCDLVEASAADMKGLGAGVYGIRWPYPAGAAVLHNDHCKTVNVFSLDASSGRLMPVPTEISPGKSGVVGTGDSELFLIGNFGTQTQVKVWGEMYNTMGVPPVVESVAPGLSLEHAVTPRLSGAKCSADPVYSRDTNSNMTLITCH